MFLFCSVDFQVMVRWFLNTCQDKQEGHRQKIKEQVTPEAVPRLYNLVKTQDDKFKLAFFAVLGNTVVAKDLDQVNSTSFLHT